MKSKYIKVFCVLLATALIFSAVFGIFEIKKRTAFFDVELKNTRPPLTDNAFLKTNGRDMKDRDGNTVVLFGVNLGGWLLQEYWMCPVSGDTKFEKWTEHQTFAVFESRFGREKAEELFEIYRDNWITEWDIKNISSMGCNVIRVPFWYRNFMYDDGTWIDENPDKNPGFLRLDWVIENARENGLYVILDMHGCPGGQSTDHCTGLYETRELYNDEKYVDIMEELWLSISKRYCDEACVAAYDIMNEPFSEQNGFAENDPVTHIYDRMYNSIRAAGDEHIIIMEAIWDFAALPYPEKTGWENCAYSVHWYGALDPTECALRASNYADEHNIPVYLGEFSDHDLFKACSEKKISCTSWTYKGSVDMGEWFMYSPNGYDVKGASVLSDSYKKIKKKWGKRIDTRYFGENTRATEFFRNENQ